MTLVSIIFCFWFTGRIAASESRFTYRSQLDHNYYDRPRFKPDLNGAIGVVPVKEAPPAPPSGVFNPPQQGAPEEEVAVTQESRVKRAISCGDNHACAYDLRMTGSDAVAQATLDTQDVVALVKERAVIGMLDSGTTLVRQILVEMSLYTGKMKPHFQFLHVLTSVSKVL